MIKDYVECYRMLSSLHGIFTSPMSLEPTINSKGRLKGVINTTDESKVPKERECTGMVAQRLCDLPISEQ